MRKILRILFTLFVFAGIFLSHTLYSEDVIKYRKEEPSVVRIDSVAAERISRKEIGISWKKEENPAIDAYVIKRREVKSGQGVGSWEVIENISGDNEPENEKMYYIDRLESDTPQQYEYRIDVEIHDSQKNVSEEGKAVLGSNVKVCIDPGHYDVSKEVAQVDEYHYIEGNVVLEIALELRDILKEQYGIDSSMTRTGDTITLGGYTDEELDNKQISLRGAYAAEEDCDLFVSLHTNSNGENANGEPTFFQPLEVNKPMIILNQRACAEEPVVAAANTIGKNLAEVSYELGLSISDAFAQRSFGEIPEWTQELNDGFGIGTVVCRTGKNGDYYGVLRGAASVDIPGMIIEHGHHSVQEVRRAAAAGKLARKWAEGDAAGIAAGFGF